jgi:hypothetical protein
VKNKLFAAVLASVAAAFSLSGCVGYEVKPPKPAEYPKADAPVPLKVGVLVKTSPFEWDAVGMSASMMDRRRGWSIWKGTFAQIDGMGGKFIEALSGSRAFARVDEVKSMGFLGSDTGGRNLFIDARFSGKYTQDPSMFPKAFLTGFFMFLPAPFIRYDDTFRASADLSVYDAGGRLVHKYAEQQDVAMEAALFSAGMPGALAAGIEDASANLAAKLVTAIIADREGFVRASKTSGEVDRRRPAPDPGTSPAEPDTASGPAATPDSHPATETASEPPEPAAPNPQIGASEIADELMP